MFVRARAVSKYTPLCLITSFAHVIAYNTCSHARWTDIAKQRSSFCRTRVSTAVDKSNSVTRSELNNAEMQRISSIHSGSHHPLHDKDRSKNAPALGENSSLDRSEELSANISSLLEVLRQGNSIDFKLCEGADAWVMDKQTLQSPFGSHDWVSADANFKKETFVHHEYDHVSHNGGVMNVDDGKAILEAVTLKDAEGVKLATLEHCKTLLNARQEFDMMVAVYSQMKWPLDEAFLRTNLPPLAREIVRAPGKPDGIKLRFEMPDHDKWEVSGFYTKMPTLGTSLRSFLLDKITHVAERLSAESIVEAKEILSSYYEIIFNRFLPSLIEQLRQLDSARIYHFDIKPDNLLVGEDGTAHIIGWGAAFKFNDVEQAEMDKAKEEELLEKLDPFPRTTQYSSYSKGLPLQSWPLFAAALCMVEALVPLPTEQLEVSSSANMHGTAFSHLVLHNAVDEAAMPTLDLKKVVVDTDLGKVVESISSRMTRTIRAAEPDLPEFKWSEGIGRSLPMLKPLISQELANHKALCVFKALEKMLAPANKRRDSSEAQGIRSSGLRDLSEECGLKTTQISRKPSNIDAVAEQSGAALFPFLGGKLQNALKHMRRAVNYLSQALERIIPPSGSAQIAHN